jgi:hypothetical protein
MFFPPDHGLVEGGAENEPNTARWIMACLVRVPLRSGCGGITFVIESPPNSMLEKFMWPKDGI